VYFGAFKTTFKDDTADAVDFMWRATQYAFDRGVCTVRCVRDMQRCTATIAQPWLAQRAHAVGPGHVQVCTLRQVCGQPAEEGPSRLPFPISAKMVEASAFLADGR